MSVLNLDQSLLFPTIHFRYAAHEATLGVVGYNIFPQATYAGAQRYFRDAVEEGTVIQKR